MAGHKRPLLLDQECVRLNVVPDNLRLGLAVASEQHELELPRFGGQFTAFTHTTGWGLVVEPRRGSISPSFPRKRDVPPSSVAESESA